MKPYIVISGTINKCISKTQTRHTGVYSTGGRLLPYDLHFYKALLKLMLSSKRYVTLRLTFCEIFVVKWPKFRTWGSRARGYR